MADKEGDPGASFSEVSMIFPSGQDQNVFDESLPSIEVKSVLTFSTDDYDEIASQSKGKIDGKQNQVKRDLEVLSNLYDRMASLTEDLSSKLKHREANIPRRYYSLARCVLDVQRTNTGGGIN